MKLISLGSMMSLSVFLVYCSGHDGTLDKVVLPFVMHVALSVARAPMVRGMKACQSRTASCCSGLYPDADV